jgi:hypothetical protein
MKSYTLRTAVVRHPQTPRHIALPLLKLIYVFDLMAIAASAAISPEVRRLAEDAILSQREGLALGQRLTLARQGSRRIAAGLLTDPDRRVIDTALDNPRLTEELVSAALLREKSGAELTLSIADHPRWSSRHPVKLALLRSKHLSLARFAAILPGLALSDLVDLAQDRRVASTMRNYAYRLVQNRKLQGRARGV